MLINKNNELIYRIDNQDLILDSVEKCEYALYRELNAKFDSSGRDLLRYFRLDNDAIGIFGTTLSKMIQDVARRRKPTLTIDSFLPAIFEPDLRAIEEIKTPYIESSGAVTYGIGTSDIAYTSVKFREESLRGTEFAIGMKWTERDLQKDMLQLKASFSHGLSIVREIIDNTYDILREDYNLKGYFGYPSEGVSGLLTDSDFQEEVVTAFYPYDNNTGRAEIYNWIKDLPMVVDRNANRYLRRPDTLLISRELENVLMRMQDTTPTELTAYSALRQNLSGLGITAMVSLPELNKDQLEKHGFFNVGDNKEIMLLYNRDQSCLRRYVSDIWTFNPMLTPTEEYKGHMRQAVTATENRYPLETLRITYPTTQAP